MLTVCRKGRLLTLGRDAFSRWGGTQVEAEVNAKRNPVRENVNGQSNTNDPYVQAQYHAYEQGHAETSTNRCKPAPARTVSI